MHSTSPAAAQANPQTRDRLLAATETLVVREGVLALSVRRIAGEAGVNTALIRYHFGDVDGLLRELALLNVARISQTRDRLLDEIEQAGTANYDAAVDALVLPLWAPAAPSAGHRAIVVLDEIFSRASPALHQEIWSLFADGVKRVAQALARALGGPDEIALAWRIRFVTAAALDIPPRSARTEEGRSAGVYGPETAEEQLLHFRRFARQALRAL